MRSKEEEEKEEECAATAADETVFRIGIHKFRNLLLRWLGLLNLQNATALHISTTSLFVISHEIIIIITDT